MNFDLWSVPGGRGADVWRYPGSNPSIKSNDIQERKKERKKERERERQGIEENELNIPVTSRSDSTTGKINNLIPDN